MTYGAARWRRPYSALGCAVNAGECTRALGGGPKFRGEISLGNTVVRLKRRRASREGGPSEKKLLHGKFLSFSILPLSFLSSSLFALSPRARDLLPGMPISATRGVTYPRSPFSCFLFLAHPRRTRTRERRRRRRRRLFRLCAWRNLSYANTRGWVT